MISKSIVWIAMIALSPAAYAEESKDPIDQANQAYAKGEYQRAVELAQKAVENSPVQAWRVLGASYCGLKDKVKAQEAITKTDKPAQQYIRYVCQRHKVLLD